VARCLPPTPGGGRVPSSQHARIDDVGKGNGRETERGCKAVGYRYLACIERNGEIESPHPLPLSSDEANDKREAADAPSRPGGALDAGLGFGGCVCFFGLAGKGRHGQSMDTIFSTRSLKRKKCSPKNIPTAGVCFPRVPFSRLHGLTLELHHAEHHELDRQKSLHVVKPWLHLSRYKNAR
jgi:hypothetical protein